MSLVSLAFSVVGFAIFLEILSTGEIFLIVIGAIIVFVCLLCFGFCQGFARAITERKLTKKWIKQISTKGADADIAVSVEFSLLVYNQNPNKYTLRYIEQHNKLAADIIRDNIAYEETLKKIKIRKMRGMINYENL